MKAILSLTLLLTLTGCDVSMAIAQSEYACRNHGGVYKQGNEFFKIRCNDGYVENYNRQTILPEGWRVGDK